VTVVGVFVRFCAACTQTLIKLRRIKDINLNTENRIATKFYLTTLFTAGVLASNAAFDSNFWQLGINRIYVETDY
jgi:hypothetical protein